jgi:hypothetical protein
MGYGQFSKEEESTYTFYECYRAKVDIMKVIDCALTAVATLKNISRSFGEDS